MALNRKQQIVVGVVTTVAVAIMVVGAAFVLNRQRRQRVLYESAQADFAKEDYNAAELKFAGAISLGSPTAEMRYRYGLCLEKTKGVGYAALEYEKAVDRDPKYLPACEKLAPFYLETAAQALDRADADPAKIEQFGKLKTCANVIMELAPDRSEGYFWRARAHALLSGFYFRRGERGDEEAARKEIEAALELLAACQERRPDDLEVAAEKIRALLQAGRMAEAENEARAGLETHANSQELLLAQAAISRVKRDRAAEEIALRRALAAAPDNVGAHIQLGQLLMRGKRTAEAEAEFKAVAAIEPDKAGGWLWLATYYESVGRAKDALAALDRAIAVAPSVGLFVKKAEQQVRARDLEGARATVRDMAKMRPPSFYQTWVDGLIAQAEGRLLAAKDCFKEAVLKSGGEWPDALMALGRVYSAEKSYGAAETQYTAAARIPRTRIPALLALADLNLIQGRADAALEQCDRAERMLAPDETPPPELAELRVRALFGQRDLAGAEKKLRQILTDAADASEKAAALGGLAQIAVERYRLAREAGANEDARNYIDRAQEYLDQARDIAPSGDNPALRAQLAWLRGDKIEAGEMLARAGASADDAVIFMRDYLPLLVVSGREEDAALAVAELLRLHGNDARVQGGVSDYYITLSKIMSAKALKATGDESERLKQQAAGFMNKGIEAAKAAYTLMGDNAVNAGRYFDLLRMNGRMAEARALADQLSLSPAGRAIGIAMQGRLLCDEKRVEEGLRRLEEATVYDNSLWQAFFWVGQAYAAAGGKDGLEKAEVAFAKALDLNPTAAPVRDAYFSILEEQGRNVTLLEKMQEAIRLSPRDRGLLERLARLQEKNGDLAGASATWARIVELVPQSGLALSERVRLLLLLGRDTDAAVSMAENAVQMADMSPQALRTLLAAYVATNKRDKAFNQLSEVLEKNPNDLNLHLLAAEFYQALGRAANVEDAVRKLVADRPNDYLPHFVLADYLLGELRYDEARREYEESLRLNSQFDLALARVVSVLIAQARAAANDVEREAMFREAERRAAMLVARFPESSRPRLAKFDILVAREDYAGAEETMRKLIEDFPRDYSLRLRLAAILNAQGKSEAAQAEIAAVLGEDPNNAGAYLQMAQLQVARNSLREAAASCEKGLTYEPANASLLDLAASLALRMGNATRAAEYLRALNRLRPADHAVLVRLVQTLLMQRRTDEALAAARAGYDRNARSWVFADEYISILVNNNYVSEAKGACEDFLKTSPDHENALLRKAWLQYEANNPDEAKLAEQTIFNSRPWRENSPSFVQRAVRLVLQRSPGRAEELLAKLAQLEDDPTTMGVIADVLKALGREDEAVQRARQAAERHSDSPAFAAAYAAILGAAGRFGEAEQACVAFLERQPGDIPIIILLAESQLKNGRKDVALATSRRLDAVLGAAPAFDNAKALFELYMRLEQHSDAERVARRLCEQMPDDWRVWRDYSTVADLQGPVGWERAIPVFRQGMTRAVLTRSIIANNLAYALTIKNYTAPEERRAGLAEAESLAKSVLGDRATAPTFLLDTLGWVYFHQNRAADAAEILEIALGRSDTLPEMRFHYAMALARLGRAERARSEVARAVGNETNDRGWRKSVEEEIARSQQP